MDILKGHIDKAIELGVDGVFFDQVGMIERPCFNPDHGHPVPLTDGRAWRMAQLRELRNYLKERRPDMSFGIECVSHFSAPFADYCHSCPGWNVATNPWEQTGEKPKLSTFVELFRYTFPEVLVSDREIRDDTDIERRVNLALLRGLVSDVEVHRCRSLIDETPHYKAHLTEANRLRERFRPLIVNGTFCDTDGVSCGNPEVSYSVFTEGCRLAVIATQSHLKEASAEIRVPGYSLRSWDALGDAQLSEGSPGTFTIHLKRHGLLVAELEVLK